METRRLLIRGLGVQVPGGAPVLTWGYIPTGSSREGRSGVMFAPRLLVSLDLVAGDVPVPVASALVSGRAGHPA